MAQDTRLGPVISGLLAAHAIAQLIRDQAQKQDELQIQQERLRLQQEQEGRLKGQADFSKNEAVSDFAIEAQKRGARPTSAAGSTPPERAGAWTRMKTAR